MVTSAKAMAPEAPLVSPPTKKGSETRERILDVALRLFVDQGYDKTSLREIAEAMGFTKAALYYHFASKDDILLALHLRLHEVGRVALRRLGEEPASIEGWSALMQDMVDEMLAQRDLILLHGRNHAAFENLVSKHQHDDDHRDLEAEIRAALRDQSLSQRDRIRLGAAMGALFFGLVLGSDIFEDIEVSVQGAQLRSVIRDILAPSA